MTLAIMLIIVALAFLAGQHEEGLLALFLSWPWWLKVGSILIAVAILGLGWLFEQSRRWPHSRPGQPEAPPSSGPPDETRSDD